MRLLLSLFAAVLLTVLSASAQVKPGIEVLRDSGFACLQGKRVALVTNPSGVDRNMRSSIEILASAPGVKLVALMAPEHGVRGDIWAGGKVESGTDPLTGLPVHSLYGATRKPAPEMLSGLDAVVYDIQDTGTRSYTFISTLGLVMRACAEKGIEVIVLDRPNPLGGLKVEGPVVTPGYFSFISQYRIPYIYGLTVGELARLINEEGLNCGQKGNEPPLKCELTVIPMEGWKRWMRYKDTGLEWVAPSPNIPDPDSAIGYPAAGLVGEFSNYLQIGIGYTLPFRLFAAPWINAEKLKSSLERLNIPGIAWRAVYYKPFSGSCAGKVIEGVQFHFVDYEKAPITLTQFYVMEACYKLYGKDPFQLSPDRIAAFNKVTGTDFVSKTLASTHKASDILEYWNKDVAPFRQLSQKYWLY
ncbi:MAG: DUF1343 domain-containing protein [Bacteroidales bacterium]|nr:DUF1343 domain-containing protein [Bacteroidales bacterium]